MQALEVAMFRLKPGSDETALMAALEQMQNFLESQGGVLQRQVFKNDEGQWLDLVLWENMDKALQAMEAAMQSPMVAAAGEVMDQQSIQMMHFHKVRDF